MGIYRPDTMDQSTEGNRHQTVIAYRDRWANGYALAI
jgi:hypothetical protein